jgi:lipopolysaccharide transport system ATP-binding protein
MAPIIEVVGIGKRYPRVKVDVFGNLRDLMVDAVRHPVRTLARMVGRTPTEHFWALHDVNFELEHGDVLGIIGANGAGKSTLLKILSRITNPSEGHAVLRGRVASLLEVGTGFHPELTGRENVYLNGAILGMTRREIAAKFDEIVAFSEVEAFLDTRVKHYSSGMYLRLAFAVAAHLEPEILVVDEVLAVGDLAFQKKCLGKMSEVSRSGRTVMFVSHNLPAVENLCSRGIVLRSGRLAFSGAAKDAIANYVHALTVEGSGTATSILDLANARTRSANVLLQTMELLDENFAPAPPALFLGNALVIRILFRLPNRMPSVDLEIGFDNLHGQRVFTMSSAFAPNREFHDAVGEQTFICRIPSLALVPGEYRIRVSLLSSTEEVDWVENAAVITVLPSDYYGTGKIPGSGLLVVPQEWDFGTVSATSVQARNQLRTD